jgi:DNA-3-methyladenine glycosylase II
MNNYYPLGFLSEKDNTLSGLIKSIGKYSIELHRDPFESLLKSIIYQQLSGKSANAIYKRFLNYYNGNVPQPEQIITTSNEIFRTKIGLSFRKIEYIKDLSSRISTKRLDLSLLPTMTDEEIITELIKVKGIGRWTAEMFLIFGLGRQDVMPLQDLAVRKAIQKLYNLSHLPDSKYILKISSSWKPYRSIATWYLWKSLTNFDNIG